jgi:uncharacterized protein YciI
MLAIGGSRFKAVIVGDKNSRHGCASPHSRRTDEALATVSVLLWRWVMKTVVIGEASGVSMEEIMKIYPRHRVVVDRFVARGVVVGIGPFDDFGNMAIFKTRAAAEEYIKEDPFIQEGVVKSIVIRDWKDSLLPD